MNVEQLINTKSKQEASFIMYNKCYYCHDFCQDKYKAWKCSNPYAENYCRNMYESFLQKELDKNEYQKL